MKPVSIEQFPAGARAGTAKQATFADIIGPMQQRLELLRETEHTETQISAISERRAASSASSRPSSATPWSRSAARWTRSKSGSS